MGARFEIQHANFIGYLTARSDAFAPRSDSRTLYDFVFAFANLPDTSKLVISSTQGTRNDWTRHIRAAGKQALDLFQRGQYFEKDILESNDVSLVLNPLRPLFQGYDIYVLVVPKDGHDHDDGPLRFFHEAAIGSHENALVLMPEPNWSGKALQFVDPFPVLQLLSECALRPPVVAFWVPEGEKLIAPLEEAKAIFRRDIMPVLGTGSRRVGQVLENRKQERRSKQILHLSDFHFGRDEASLRRRWLLEHLRGVASEVDRVVVTGDLFDTPDAVQRAAFDDFRHQLEEFTKKEILVIPGNHDVRSDGNALGSFLGRNSEYAVDLRWEPMTIDEEMGVVFFAFNSSKSGDFARGNVDEQQRLDRAALFDVAARRDSKLGGFARVALVHHHPISYEAQPSAFYEKLLAKLFGGGEYFISFHGSDEFLRWCNAREISLVLHGHKHIPKFIQYTPGKYPGVRPITIVGCGSTTGVDKRPMCYDIISYDCVTKNWNVMFFHDEAGDGSGFRVQNVTVDLKG